MYPRLYKFLELLQEDSFDLGLVLLIDIHSWWSSLAVGSVTPERRRENEVSVKCFNVSDFVNSVEGHKTYDRASE